MKTITYRGLEIEVPDWAKFVATDSDGSLWVFERSPFVTAGRWIRSSGKCDWIPVTDWAGSLEPC